MSCEKCRPVHLGSIIDPGQYILCLNSFLKMQRDGDMELAFASSPIETILDGESHWTRNKYFHQFRCTHCGMIYGMLYNINTGGQVIINHKVFDPADYPDVPKAGGQSE